jgi:hypothetical protein
MHVVRVLRAGMRGIRPFGVEDAITTFTSA